MYYFFTNFSRKSTECLLPLKFIHISVGFECHHLVESDIKFLTYFLLQSRGHDYIDGYNQIYRTLIKQEITSDTLNIRYDEKSFNGDGLSLILSYIQVLRIWYNTSVECNAIYLTKMTELLNKLNQNNDSYCLTNLETDVDISNLEYFETVCNTMQYVSILCIRITLDAPTMLSYFHDRVKQLHELNKLNLKELFVKYSEMCVLDDAHRLACYELFDCIKYVPKVVVRCYYEFTFNHWKIISKEHIEIWETQIDTWISKNKISMKKVVKISHKGSLRCSIK